MKIDWYFDFISPFAYLQHAQFSRLPTNVEVNYKPILFAGLLKHWQNIGPAEIPPKRIFTYKHCYWLAKKQSVPFKMPPAHPFNSLAALRLAIASGAEKQSVQVIFDCIWKYGLALDSHDAREFLCSQLNLTDLDNLIDDPDVKQQLRVNTEEAAMRGVFGVPTFSVQAERTENFWGLDAFDMLLDFLDDPVEFNDAEMQRIEILPEGTQRKR